MKYPKSPVLLFAFVCVLFASATLHAQSASAPLSTVLNPDGSLKANTAGSFDPSGLRMTYGPKGEPRFVSESERVGGCTPDSWDTTFSLNGADNNVQTVVGDGAGNVYIGGNFSAVGNVAASRIAKWNGTSWSALGTGVGGGNVFAIAISGGDVYVGGGFTSAGGAPANHIAKWNGASWSAMGSGLGLLGNDYVNDIAVSGADVYTGGHFTDPGSLNYIARWNGTSWVSLGTGMDQSVYTLAVSGTDVYAGGVFSTAGGVTVPRVAKWDGTSWSAMGTGIGGATVSTLTVSGSDLYAGAGGVLAKWNGASWATLGTVGGSQLTINTILVSGTDIYVGGGFTTAGGSPANRIAKWNGSSWSSLGAGVGNSLLHTVTGLAFSGSTLIVGGDFPVAGGSVAKNLTRFESGTWTAFNGTGLDGGVNAVAVSGTDVYVGGTFIMAGSVVANKIVKWNSLTNTWSSLGTGLPNDNTGINALAVAGNKLYAGGTFSAISGVSANNIAVWNGTTWASLGTGVNASVRVLGVKGEDVYAAGDFITAGEVTANRIAKWNGTAWSGLNSSILPTTVVTMAFMGNDIYVGTPTTTVANPAYFSKYDGTSWTALGADLGDRGVSSVAVIGTDVYVSGGFIAAGAITVNRIAKWNGSSWSALGGGLPPSSFSGITGARLAVSGSNLIAVGDFTVATGGPGERAAKWDGTSWSPLGHGLNGNAGSVAAAGGDIFVGGAFTTAGCNLSPYFARWRETVWTGMTNSDWHTGTNWGSGSVPIANASVTISSADASISSADVVMNGLIVTNGRTLTIGAGRTLTVNGTLDLTNGTLAGPGNLIVNDLSLNGGTVTGVGSTVVNGNLLLGSGSITGGPITITSCRTGALVGGSASLFLNAPLTRCVNSTGTYRFPVGTGSVYAPVELANVVGSGNFTVEPKSGAHPGATGLPTNRLQRWWDMTNGGITQADMTFTYADSEVVGRENWYRIYGINGGTATQFPSVINTTTNRMTVTGVTTFGSWTLGEGTPVPRTLTGRLTNPSGRGAFNIQVSLTDDQGNIRYTMVNPFGYYRFLDVPTFRVYTVKVSSKKFTFPTPQRTVEFDEFTTSINFVSSDN